MNEFLDKINTFTTMLGKSVGELFKHHTTRSITIEELSSLIINHKTVQVTKKELLGLVFNFYTLQIDDIVLILETKGNKNEQILEIKIRDNENTLFSFKSYENVQNTQQFSISEYVYSKFNLSA